MNKRSYVVCLVALFVLSALPALAQQAETNRSLSSDACREAIKSYARATHDYLAAKFALDRATQLLASARYSSIVGKMKINMVIRESEVATALPRYAAAIGEAYAAIATLKAVCPSDALPSVSRLPSSSKLKERLDKDLVLFVGRGVDRLADDQMSDIRKMFDDMKSRQK